jgi:putative ABC transport system permease protein
MIANYFRIAFRYLLKNKTFSLVNIFGLTLGFLCFTLITLYLHDELSFDKFHADNDRMFRTIQHEESDNGTTRDVATVSARIAPEAAKQLPEVEDAIRISALGRITMGNDPANRDYETTLTADPNFFKFFSFPMLEGDPNTALANPDGIVMSERAAEKYFGREPAMGKRIWVSLTRNSKYIEFEVTGIMKNFPANSHLQIDIIFSEPTWPTIFPWYQKYMASDWESNTFLTYVKLKPGADKKAVEEKLSTMVKANYPATKQFKSSFSLQPMADIHLFSDNIQDSGRNANGISPFYLYMFAAVGILILLIACLNYMNLSTAAAFKRTREIGTRKTLGALKSQLIGQFTGEAILLSLVSLMLALMLLQLVLPSVNAFTEKDMALATLPIKWMYLIFAAVIFRRIVFVILPGVHRRQSETRRSIKEGSEDRKPKSARTQDPRSSAVLYFNPDDCFNTRDLSAAAIHEKQRPWVQPRQPSCCRYQQRQVETEL